MVHRSKKDLWIVLLVATAVVGPFVAGLASLVGPRPDPARGLILLSAGVGFAALLALLAVPTRYEITPSVLIIRSGVLRHRIPLVRIEAIRPTRNPLSAPAWSLDRLRIDYRAGERSRMALVSPADQTAFLTEIAQADPALRPSDRGLIRAAGP